MIHPAAAASDVDRAADAAACQKRADLKVYEVFFKLWKRWATFLEFLNDFEIFLEVFLIILNLNIFEKI